MNTLSAAVLTASEMMNGFVQVIWRSFWGMDRLRRTATGTWEPSSDQLAQTSHIALAGWFVFACTYFGLPPWATALIGIALAAIKEGVIDIYGPEKDSWSDSLEDFAWYVASGIVNMFIVWLKG